jgi:hypothetical protein
VVADGQLSAGCQVGTGDAGRTGSREGRTLEAASATALLGARIALGRLATGSAIVVALSSGRALAGDLEERFFKVATLELLGDVSDGAGRLTLELGESSLQLLQALLHVLDGDQRALVLGARAKADGLGLHHDGLVRRVV